MTRNKKIINKYYDACSNLYDDICDGKYIRLKTISRKHLINDGFFKALLDLDVIIKIANGVYKWNLINHDEKLRLITHDEINIVLDRILRLQTQKLKNKSSEIIDDVEENTDIIKEEEVVEEEEIKNTVSNEEITICSSERKNDAFEIMKLLIENKSVELEKVPSTSVSLLDSLYLKLGYEEDNN